MLPIKNSLHKWRYTDWKWRAGKRYTTQMEAKKWTGVARLVSDKTNFKSKTVKRAKDIICWLEEQLHSCKYI